MSTPHRSPRRRSLSGSALAALTQSGYGTSFLPDLGTYLTSPFALLVGVFPRTDTDLAVYVVTVLKTAVAAAATAWLLRTHRRGPWWAAGLLGASFPGWTRQFEPVPWPDLLARLLPATYSFSSPALFVGTGTLLLVAALPLHRAVPVRTRLWWTGLTAAVLLSSSGRRRRPPGAGRHHRPRRGPAAAHAPPAGDRARLRSVALRQPGTPVGRAVYEDPVAPGVCRAGTRAYLWAPEYNATARLAGGPAFRLNGNAPRNRAALQPLGVSAGRLLPAGLRRARAGPLGAVLPGRGPAGGGGHHPAVHRTDRPAGRLLGHPGHRPGRHHGHGGPVGPGRRTTAGPGGPALSGSRP
ncbi:YfhO family protein [Streptomyces sp. NPDC044571]|uniref:YfhO family protein n=1 Tax=Streptomyces sp. NPDC044571 TaxID=3155371 RepID=UPI0033F54584